MWVGVAQADEIRELQAVVQQLILEIVMPNTTLGQSANLP